MKLPHLSVEEQQQFEQGVMQVNGKSMNRTALGIIDAFLKLYPQATFADLKAAFPDHLNPTAPKQAPKSIFKPYSDSDFGVVHDLAFIQSEFAQAGLPYDGLFFTEPETQFKTADGITVVVNKLWESTDAESGSSDLEQLANQAKNYGIVVNKFEPKSAFSRGTYSIDVIHPVLASKLGGKIEAPKSVTPVVPEKKSGLPIWVWIIGGLILLLLLLWALGLFNSKKPAEVTSERTTTDTVYTERIVTRVDTVFVEAIEDLESKFNTVQFAVKKSDIPEEAKYALYDLAKVLNKNTEVKLKVEGHTSKEGNPQFNKTLSEKRAKAVVAFLISRGVDSTRLSYEGMGSSVVLDSINLDKNRRTEFVILSE